MDVWIPALEDCDGDVASFVNEDIQIGDDKLGVHREQAPTMENLSQKVASLSNVMLMCWDGDRGTRQFNTYV